jgi:hypothetical protein
MGSTIQETSLGDSSADL